MKYFKDFLEPFKRNASSLIASITPAPTPRPNGDIYALPKSPSSSTDHPMAMDEATDMNLGNTATWAAGQFTDHAQFEEGIGFLGYPYLAELCQRSEYRQVIEVNAEEMTRKWIKVKSTGTDDKMDRIKKIEDAMLKFRLKDVFRRAIEHDGIYGHVFIYPDIHRKNVAAWDDGDELETKLSIDSSKIGKGCLKHFTIVDPMWASPLEYNTTNPLDPTFYEPQLWQIQTKRVHASRLIHIRSKTIPDLLKPRYNFGAPSTVQLLKPAVQNFLRTRQSVADLIQSFTIWKFGTDMSAMLQDGENANTMMNRAAYLAAMKQHYGLFVHDKANESLENISVPLGSLDALQSQSLENIAAPARMSLLKLLGFVPKGLNGSTDGDIRVNYDATHASQEKILRHPIKVALDLIMLNEFGEIDPDITFEFEPLWSIDSTGEAAVLKAWADIYTALIAAGVVSPDEVRDRLANDPESGWSNLKGPAPEMPDLAMPSPNGNASVTNFKSDEPKDER